MIFYHISGVYFDGNSTSSLADIVRLSASRSLQNFQRQKVARLVSEAGIFDYPVIAIAALVLFEEDC